MNIDQFKHHFAISDEQILDHVKANIDQTNCSCVLQIGSLVENIGNHVSDLDILVIEDNSHLGHRSIGSLLNEVVCDIDVLSLDYLNKLISKLLKKHDSQLSFKAMDLCSPEECLFLHRVVNSKLLHGKYPAGIDKQKITIHLCQLNANRALNFGRSLQLDLVGLVEEADWQTCLMASKELMDKCCTALVALLGFSNQTSKWRIKLLANLNVNWLGEYGIGDNETPIHEFILDLYTHPKSLEKSEIIVYAQKVVSFFRTISLLKATKFDGVSVRIPYPNFNSACEYKIDTLELDVTISQLNDGLKVHRLNGHSSHHSNIPVELASVLLLFDGVTSRERIISIIEMLWPNEDANEKFNDINTYISYTQLNQ